MRAEPRPYWHPYLGALLLGLVLGISFLLTGHGLGNSGGIGRLVASAEHAVAPEAVDTNPYLGPIAGGDNDAFEHWIMWAILGALLGGFSSGLIGGRLGFEIRKGPRISVGQRLFFATIGGILVGYGARLARGCTSGQALSGGAVLSAGSWAFMIMVFVGGYLLARPVRRLWN